MRADPREWITRNILPHLASLETWLQRRGIRDAGDIVQDCVLKLLNAEGLEQIRQPKNYLTATAMSFVISSARRTKIAQFEPLGSDVSQLIAHEPLQDRVLGGRQELEHVQRQFERLTQRRRTILVMRRLQRKSTGDVARALKISASLVEKELRIATRDIRRACGRS